MPPGGLWVTGKDEVPRDGAAELALWVSNAMGEQ